MTMRKTQATATRRADNLEKARRLLGIADAEGLEDAAYRFGRVLAILERWQEEEAGQDSCGPDPDAGHTDDD